MKCRVIVVMLLALILVSACSSASQSNNTPTQAQSDQWKPATNIPGVLRRNVIGDPGASGPFKFQLRVPAGARAAVHKHNIEVRVKVVSGSMFIIIGEPIEPTRAQRFAAGSSFVLPAHTWHEEWWDEESVVEGEGVGPMENIYKTPAAASATRLGSSLKIVKPGTASFSMWS